MTVLTTRVRPTEAESLEACSEAVDDLAALRLDDDVVQILDAYFNPPDAPVLSENREAMQSASTRLLRASMGLPSETRKSKVATMLRAAGIL